MVEDFGLVLSQTDDDTLGMSPVGFSLLQITFADVLVVFHFPFNDLELLSCPTDRLVLLIDSGRQSLQLCSGCDKV